jgi:hypothetical protein
MKSLSALVTRRAGELLLRKRHTRAQTTVEFALILWPFFIILFACCDYAQIYFYEHSIRHALREAGRFATTGKVLMTNTTGSTPIMSGYVGSNYISRQESIRRWFHTNSVIAVPLADIDIVSWPTPPNYTNTEISPAQGPGYANDYVKISVYYPIQLITPVSRMLFSNGVYHLTVSSIFLNEPSKNFITYTNRYTAEPL